MTSIVDVGEFLKDQAPHRLAEDWDNVGLLVGDARRPVHRLMTCLTITGEVVEEAIEGAANLIVAHHPLPFRPLKQVTTEQTAGRLLLQIVENRIAIYSPHTAFDSAAHGINEQLARGVGLDNVRPLMPGSGNLEELGSGRLGEFAQDVSLGAAIDRVKRFLGVPRVQVVGDESAAIRHAAIGCGSAGQFLEPAHRAGCELLITGEVNFHTCLEAKALGVSLILPGHYASERFAVEGLAGTIAKRFPDLEVWASRAESDPLRWI